MTLFQCIDFKVRNKNDNARGIVKVFQLVISNGNEKPKVHEYP
jgi:hypothetical protein